MERRKDLPVRVSEGDSDPRTLRRTFTPPDGVPQLPHRFDLGTQRPNTPNGVWTARYQVHAFEEGLELIVGEPGKEDLARCPEVDRNVLPHLDNAPYRVCPFDAVDMDAEVATPYGQDDGLMEGVAQTQHVGDGEVAQICLIQPQLGEGQQAKTELVLSRILVLLDEAVLTQRCQQPEGRRLRELNRVGDFAQTHAGLLGGEDPQYPGGTVDGLDRVLALPLGHLNACRWDVVGRS